MIQFLLEELLGVSRQIRAPRPGVTLLMVEIMKYQRERLQIFYLASEGDGTRLPPSRTVRDLPM